MKPKWPEVPLFFWIAFAVSIVAVAATLLVVLTKSNVTAVADGLRYGMRREYVVEDLGSPDLIAHSLSELRGEPYPIPPVPVGEEILLYSRYPWGVFVYIDEKEQRVTRLVLIRHI